MRKGEVEKDDRSDDDEVSTDEDWENNIIKIKIM